MTTLYIVIAFLAGATISAFVAMFILKKQHSQPQLQQIVPQQLPTVFVAPTVLPALTPETALASTPYVNSFVISHEGSPIDGLQIPSLVFERVEPSLVAKNINERIYSGFSSMLPATVTNSLVTQGVVGTFKTTADASTLMKFGSGGFGTAVIGEGGKIQGHVGFTPVDATKVFTPLAAFQLMSIATGQYYLNGITKQLNGIAEKLETLIHYHHNAKIAELQSCYSAISDLLRGKSFTSEDAAELKRISHSISAIKTEYTNLLMGISESTFRSANLDGWWFTPTIIESLKKKWSDSQATLYAEVVLFARQLVPLAQMAEFKVNSVLSRHDPTRVDKCRELIENLMGQQSIITNDTILKKVDSICNDAVLRIYCIKKTAVRATSQEKVNDLLKDVQSRRKRLKELAERDNNFAQDMITNLREQMSKKCEILVVADSEGIRMLQE